MDSLSHRPPTSCLTGLSSCSLRILPIARTPIRLIFNSFTRKINNTATSPLSLWRRWEYGRGSIRSEHNQPSLASGTNGESSISQDLHYRSLGLINNTRWVYRTAKGGDFEWVSTNSLSSTPQSLAIGGDRTARQDIELTALSTINSFRLLRDLRSHKWAISASAV